jgi:hypothetical protein
VLEGIVDQAVMGKNHAAGRGTDFGRLTMAQIAALRFASDAELPGLIGRAVNERLTSDQIKRAVTDWQGDYFRT